MEEIVKAFKTYFTFLEEHKANYENAMSKASQVVVTLDSLSERLQAVSNSLDDSKINRQFPVLKSSLTFKILMAIEKQLNIVMGVIHKLQDSTINLNNYLAVVEKTLKFSKMKCTTPTNEVPSAPLTVEQLWECATDCRQYYQARYSEIHMAYCCLDFRDSNTVLDFNRAFQEDKDSKKYLNRCFAVGQSLICTS